MEPHRAPAVLPDQPRLRSPAATSYDVIIDTIVRVTTKTGLTAIAVLDENAYPTGTEIGDEQMRDIEERCLIRSEWHGEWNYTLLAHPAAPRPVAGTAPPDQARQEALNHPALTGLQPGDVKALAAALEVPFDADREQKYHLRRRACASTPSAGPASTETSAPTSPTTFLILRLRDHLCLTAKAAAVLFGIHPTSVSRAVTLTRRLIDENAIPVPAAAGPPPEPIRTIDDLRKYASQHGIEIFILPAGRQSPRSHINRTGHTANSTYFEMLPMDREFPGCPFERYADDIIAHCDSEDQARQLRAAIAARLETLGLELHPGKTKVAYCKDANRRGDFGHTSFDFLGYTFRGRLAKGPRGYFTGFSPAISAKAKKAKGKQIRDWHLNRRSSADLSGLAREINPQVQGWINYYGAFYRSELSFLAWRINEHLVRWAMHKFKRFRGKYAKATAWLQKVYQYKPGLFAHWQLIAFT